MTKLTAIIRLEEFFCVKVWKGEGGGLGTMSGQPDRTIQPDIRGLDWPNNERFLSSKNHKPLCISWNYELTRPNRPLSSYKGWFGLGWSNDERVLDSRNHKLLYIGLSYELRTKTNLTQSMPTLKKERNSYVVGITLFATPIISNFFKK